MKITIHKIDLDASGNPMLTQVAEKDVVLKYEAELAIDGSTSNSGVAILRKTDGSYMYSLAVTREDKEEPVRYKVEFKRFLERLLRNHREIRYIRYEEPILGYATAIPNLMMLRTMVEELKIETEPEFNYVGNSEVNNKRWKKAFLAPAKCPNDTEEEKKAVKAKVVEMIPWLADVTQDEIDAFAMGYAAIQMRNNGYEENELQSKKKTRPFEYNIEFVGADSFEDAVEDVLNNPRVKIPAVVLENGLRYVEIEPRANFDKTVYSEMGDEDKLVVLSFSSDKHGDVILKHRIGTLAALNDTLYAFVWRKSRKR